MTDAVSYRVVNGVAWLTIERPQARNALNAAAREGLYAGVRRFNDDEAAKVLVLTGAGEKAFCAGGDLKEMADTALTCRGLTSSRRPSGSGRRSTAARTRRKGPPRSGASGRPSGPAADGGLRAG